MIDLDYFKKYQNIIGLDEVGRGPIAGPVVACGVKVHQCQFHTLSQLGIKDSKKISQKKRKSILQQLDINTSKLQSFKRYHRVSFDFILWEIEAPQIDQMNILQASLLCMQKCFESLYCAESFALIDGNRLWKGAYSCEAIIKGDSKSLLIGLAAIIAKDFRDEKMKIYSNLYPDYGLEKHAGYPTAAHKEAVKNYGVTPLHRKSFKGVREYVSNEQRS